VRSLGKSFVEIDVVDFAQPGADAAVEPAIQNLSWYGELFANGTADASSWLRLPCGYE
jgi:hypothetical protein